MSFGFLIVEQGLAGRLIEVKESVNNNLATAER